jgi:acyl transferase domain-containing protein
VLLNSLGVLEIQGVEVNWAGFDRDYQRRRVPLPTYPFERQRYWFESNKQRDGKLLDVKESDTRLSTPQVEATPKITQPDSIRSQLRVIVAGLLHADSAQIDVHAPFLEMGADSLVMLEAVRTIETTFGVKIAIRQFFEGLATIDALATYIDRHITPEWSLKVYPQAEVKPAVSSQHSAVATSVGATEDVSRHGVPNKTEEIAISCYAAKPDKIALPLFWIFRSHLITISPSFNNLCSNCDNSSTDLNRRCAIYSFAECQTNSIKL